MSKKMFAAALIATGGLFFAGCGGGGGGDGGGALGSKKTCQVESIGNSHADSFNNVISTNCEFIGTVKDQYGRVLGYAVSTPSRPSLAQVNHGNYPDYCSIDLISDSIRQEIYFANSECEVYGTERYRNGDSTRCFYVYRDTYNEISCN